MVDPTLLLPGLSPIQGKEIVARFDGGLLVLREIERRLSVADRLAACIADPRDPGSTVHTVADIIRFRLLMIAAGYEDGNDATSLRIDPLFKLALERVPSDRNLCSQSTISLRPALAISGPAAPRTGSAAPHGSWFTTGQLNESPIEIMRRCIARGWMLGYGFGWRSRHPRGSRRSETAISCAQQE